jgi:hypothetical protein
MTAPRILATFALLVATATADATRVLEQPERSVELSLAQLALPSSGGGGLTFKECADCPYSTHVLTQATQYFANGQTLPFEEFARVVAELEGNRRAADRAFAVVFLDVDTGRVTRVTLHHPGL